MVILCIESRDTSSDEESTVNDWQKSGQSAEVECVRMAAGRRKGFLDAPSFFLFHDHSQNDISQQKLADILRAFSIPLSDSNII